MPRGVYDRSPKASAHDVHAVSEPPDAVSTLVPDVVPSLVPLAEDMPQRMRLIAAHGYIEDRFNRGVFHWPAGTVLTSQDEIDHLRERGAMMEPDA